MNLLFLSSWYPSPPNNGSRQRAFHLLRALAERHSVSLLTFDEGGQKDPAALEQICRVAGVVPRAVFQPNRLRALLGFFSTAPRFIYDTYSTEMAALIRRELQSNNYDVVVASESATAHYADLFHLPAVYDEMQLAIPYQAWHRRGWDAQRVRAGLRWLKLRTYTRRLLGHFGAVTVASAMERSIARQVAPGARVEVIPNGVDTINLQPGMVDPAPGTLIYNGALTYSANYDAVQYFLTQCWGQVLAQRPDARLTITGSTRGVDVARLMLTPEVTMSGYLDDIRPTVAGAWACIVPLRVGGGTRLKILEAMALGTPVISTPKGAEGLQVTDGEDILLAATPAEFVAQTVRLLNESALRQRLTLNARRLVEANYAWEAIGSQFLDLVEGVRG